MMIAKLQNSRGSNGAKEPTNINALFDGYLRLAFHGLRAKKKSFNATVKTDFDDKLEEINIVPQDNGKVLLNLFQQCFYAVQQKQKELTSTEVAPFQKVSPLYQPTVTVTTRKLSPPSGAVELSGGLSITVMDDGNGITTPVEYKIFKPFFTTKPTRHVTGLGLSLSYDIIKAHGDELTVVTKEGEGADFIIDLPIK